MRILFNGPPPAADAAADVDPGRPIRQPGRWAGAILAGSAGFVLFSVSAAAIIAAVNVLLNLHVIGFTYVEFSLTAGIPIVIALTVVAHELAHALLHPGFGLTDSSILFLDWRRLQFGVYYEGPIPRARWIAMRLFPMVLWTVLPSLFLLVVLFRTPSVWGTYLIVMILANSLGSGGDLAAVLIVLCQVPPTGVLNFFRGKAYWLRAEKDRT
jgi:hypothetical protein